MQAFICDYVRTPIGRYGGALASVRTDDLAALPLKKLLAQNVALTRETVDEVILGCANQAGEDNRNVARMATLLADSDQKAINQTSRALRWSNKLHDDVSWLVRYLHFALKDEAPELADLKLMRVHHCWEDLGRLMRVHVAACGSGDSRCESVLHRATLIPEASLDPAPLLDGHSLISIGISHGPITGRIIKSVRRAQLNEEINSTDDALRLARELAAGSDGSD